jgi:Delta7-sterol 5-desaturase
VERSWIASLLLVIVAHDAYFYWAHRWMHRPGVFRRIHRTHHLSVAPTQWAAYSFSVGEAALQAAFLPVFLLIVPAHTTVLFIWMAHQVMHHEHGRYNYGLYFAWWDRWCGTEHPDYRRRLASLISGIEQGRALQPRAMAV